MFLLAKYWYTDCISVFRFVIVIALYCLSDYITYLQFKIIYYLFFLVYLLWLLWPNMLILYRIINYWKIKQKRKMGKTQYNIIFINIIANITRIQQEKGKNWHQMLFSSFFVDFESKTLIDHVYTRPLLYFFWKSIKSGLAYWDSFRNEDQIDLQLYKYMSKILIGCFCL